MASPLSATNLQLLNSELGRALPPGNNRFVVWVLKALPLNTATQSTAEVYVSTRKRLHQTLTPEVDEHAGRYRPPNVELTLIDETSGLPVYGVAPVRGQIELINERLPSDDPLGETGRLDKYATHLYSWVGRPLVGYIGGDQMDFSNYSQYWESTCAAIVWTDQGVVIDLAEALQDFQKPLQANYYGAGYTVEWVEQPAGGNDPVSLKPITGVTVFLDLFGVLQPLCYGLCRAVEPVQLSVSDEIWQWHVGVGTTESEELLTSFSGGHAHDPADYTVDLDSSTITYDNAQSNVVTLDVKGGIDDGAAAYIDRIDDIVTLLLTENCGITAASIDSTALGALATAFDYTTGIHVGPSHDVTRGEAIHRLLRPMGTMFQTRGGKLSFWWLQEPYDPTSAPNLTLDEEAFVPGTISLRTIPPAWRIRLGFQPRYRPLSGSEMVGAVSQGEREKHGREFLFVEWRDKNVAAWHANAQDLTLYSNFDEEADAQAVADYLGEILKHPRRLLSAELRLNAINYDAGDRVTVALNRYGLMDAVTWEFEDGATIQFEDDEPVEGENPAAGAPGYVVGYIDNPRDQQFGVKVWV